MYELLLTRQPPVPNIETDKLGASYQLIPSSEYLMCVSAVVKSIPHAMNLTPFQQIPFPITQVIDGTGVQLIPSGEYEI